MIVKPLDSHRIVCVLIFVFLSLCSIQIQAQTRVKTVAGTVVDTLGKAMAGVNIVSLSDRAKATSTDASGKFVLEASEGTTLKFTLVGYTEHLEIVPTDRSILNVVMRESSDGIDEVVVTALGQKQRREAIVGAVTTVKPGELRIPASNLTNAMAGKIAGVIAFQPSGQPGLDNSNFFIRGVTTFGYKRDPLILIDNTEMTANDLARLQVDDIESFSVLKDASATSLYGARGGNGVILVKTKEGREGKASIGLRMEQSISQPVRSLELADPVTYMMLYNEAMITRNPLAPRPYSQNKIANTLATMNGHPDSNPYVYPAVDWLDMLFKKRTTTERINLNVSGGGGVAKYYVAGSLSNDNGILRNDIRNNNNSNVNFKNYQLRSNVNINLSPSTEMIVRLSGNFNEYTGPMTFTENSYGTDLYNLATHTSPVDFPAYYLPDAANQQTNHILFGNEPDGPGSTNLRFSNPYAALLRGNQRYSESRMLAQFELNQSLRFITEGLNFHATASTNRYAIFRSTLAYAPFYYNIQTYDRASDEYTLNWINSQPDQAREYLNYYNNGNNLSTFLYLQGTLDYNRAIGENHNVSAALIYSQQQTLNGNANSLFNSLPFRNLNLAGRATYSYSNRYFFEFNFGYNGSERFSENHRYGFFPTIGGSWILSEEPFYGEGLRTVVDRWKLRASYGMVGNDAISDRRFFYLSDVNLNDPNRSAMFGTNNAYGRDGVSIRNYENRNVTWEVSRQLNLGTEMTLFKDFRVIAEYFRNLKSDVLQDRASIPTSMGLEAPISANIGKVESQGFELSLDGRKNLNSSLWLAAMGNFTFATNKFLEFEEPAYNEQYRYMKGQPLNRHRAFIAERLFVDDYEAQNSPTQIFSSNGIAPMGGDIKYRDLNGDGKIDFDDQAFVGYPTIPQIVYGFGFSMGYKGFDLSSFFQGQSQVSFMIDAARTSPFIKSPDAIFPGDTQLLQAYADNHWSEANQNLYALYPRLGTNGAIIENNRQVSTWWMRNGSFLRLKSLEFGYTLPARWSERLHMKNFRIYFNGQNLLTWAPFKMWDPELGGNGFNYPLQKVFNVGLNVNL